MSIIDRCRVVDDSDYGDDDNVKVRGAVTISELPPVPMVRRKLRRGESLCGACGGETVIREQSSEWFIDERTCPHCKGTGIVPRKPRVPKAPNVRERDTLVTMAHPDDTTVIVECPGCHQHVRCVKFEEFGEREYRCTCGEAVVVIWHLPQDGRRFKAEHGLQRAPGELVGLSDRDRAAIRAAAQAGATQKALALRYGVSKSVIYSVVHE